MKQRFDKDNDIQNAFDKVRGDKPSRAVLDKANDYAAAHPKRLKGKTTALILHYGISFVVIALILPIVFILTDAPGAIAKNSAPTEFYMVGDSTAEPIANKTDSHSMYTEPDENVFCGDIMNSYDIAKVHFNDVIHADETIGAGEEADDVDKYVADIADDEMALTKWYYQNEIIADRAFANDLMEVLQFTAKEFSFVLSDKEIVATLSAGKCGKLIVSVILDNELPTSLTNEIKAKNDVEYSVTLLLKEEETPVRYYAYCEQTETNNYVTAAIVNVDSTVLYLEYITDAAVEPEELFAAAVVAE